MVTALAVDLHMASITEIVNRFFLNLVRVKRWLGSNGWQSGAEKQLDLMGRVVIVEAKKECDHADFRVSVQNLLPSFRDAGVLIGYRAAGMPGMPMR